MRSYHQLTQNHRYQISRMLSRKKSVIEISKALGVHRSTVYRELKRNSFDFPFDGRSYDARVAEQLSFQRKCDRRRCFRKIQGEIKSLVEAKLKEGWSPEQIAGRLRYERSFKLSHETIYRHILWDSYGYGDLWRHLHSAKRRRKRLPSRKRWIEQRRFINQRPKAAERRSELGHWERDLIVGRNRASYLLTLVDRKSRFTKIARLQTRRAMEAHKSTERALRGQPKKTITSDNGVEFMMVEQGEALVGCRFFYTNPYCSWEKGTNENTNGIIRRYLPKKEDFRETSLKSLKAIEKKLNT